MSQAGIWHGTAGRFPGESLAYVRQLEYFGRHPQTSSCQRGSEFQPSHSLSSVRMVSPVWLPILSSAYPAGLYSQRTQEPPMGLIFLPPHFLQK